MYHNEFFGTCVFPFNYDSKSATTILGRASPAQGAMAPTVQITTDLTRIGTSSKLHTGAVAGGVKRWRCGITSDWDHRLDNTYQGGIIWAQGLRWNSSNGWFTDLVPTAPAFATCVGLPVGVSSKGLAQLRSRSQPTYGPSLNRSPTVITDKGGAVLSSEAEDRRLRW
ncbi:hypothetical protein BJY52DRAFT_1228456 [Lactarius psammicola]|nr:hypothetical protein BJY52DRAFT_1228456 [Lactarius psammicola]